MARQLQLSAQLPGHLAHVGMRAGIALCPNAQFVSLLGAQGGAQG